MIDDTIFNRMKAWSRGFKFICKVDLSLDCGNEFKMIKYQYENQLEDYEKLNN